MVSAFHLSRKSLPLEVEHWPSNGSLIRGHPSKLAAFNTELFSRKKKEFYDFVLMTDSDFASDRTTLLSVNPEERSSTR